MESTAPVGMRPVEGHHAVPDAPSFSQEMPAAPDNIAQALSGMPEDPATQQQIAQLQEMLRQGEGGMDGHGETRSTPIPKEILSAGHQNKGMMQALKSLFHYLTFNIFKKK